MSERRTDAAPTPARSARAALGHESRGTDPAPDRLPFIDEHVRAVDAPPERVWEALLRVLRRQMGSSGTFARILGCDPDRSTAEFSGRRGETVPGFRIADAEPGRRLVLRGRHRFADYALTFVLDGSTLRARTHAAFPGLRGRLYRAAVLGSGGHRIATRRLLERVAREASRADRPDPERGAGRERR